MHRWEFDREKQAKKEATLAAADADRVAFRSIDWHDFVVVEVRRPRPRERKTCCAVYCTTMYLVGYFLSLDLVFFFIDSSAGKLRIPLCSACALRCPVD